MTAAGGRTSKGLSEFRSRRRCARQVFGFRGRDSFLYSERHGEGGVGVEVSVNTLFRAEKEARSASHAWNPVRWEPAQALPAEKGATAPAISLPSSISTVSQTSSEPTHLLDNPHGLLASLPP
jgi:hypothetical protein